jgi:lysophospholipase L1-like esterase
VRYKKIILFSILGVFVLFGFQAQSQEKQKTKYYPYWHQKETHFRSLPNEANEIIFLGDSITDGCNWSEMFHDLRIKNRGISADITDGVLDRLDEVMESKPLKVFLMIGVNDLARGKTVDYIVRNIERILVTIQKETPQTGIYLESLLPVNPVFELAKNHTNKTAEIIAINAALKKMAEDRKLTFVDLHSLFKTESNRLDPEYTNDGLHLTGKGYLVWKSAIEKYLY